MTPSERGEDAFLRQERVKGVLFGQAIGDALGLGGKFLTGYGLVQAWSALPPLPGSMRLPTVVEIVQFLEWRSARSRPGSAASASLPAPGDRNVPGQSEHEPRLESGIGPGMVSTDTPGILETAGLCPRCGSPMPQTPPATHPTRSPQKAGAEGK